MNKRQMPAEFKTPRPVPVFYSSNSCSFSTKKERRAPLYHSQKSKSVAKLAPLVSRIFDEWWISRKPQQVSFKNHSYSEAHISNGHYDITANESYFNQCFSVEAKIGEGSFGEVFRVRSKEDGRLYAIKRTIGTFRSATHRLEKLSEVQKHEKLPKHQNLVRFHKAWEELGSLYIQTELCKTSLDSYSENYHELPESLVWNYMIDLLMAVKHLHDHDFVHLDIKPENILISHSGQLKLGDFGLVVDLNQTDHIIEGDSKYLAPELLSGKISKKADIFSLGISILEIACDLDLPSQGETWHFLRCGDLPDSLMSHLSEELCQIIKSMMNPDHTLRPSASELLKTPLLRHLIEYRKLMVAYNKLQRMTRTLRLLFWMWRCFLTKHKHRRSGSNCCNASLLQSCCRAASATYNSTGGGGLSQSSRLKRKNAARNASFTGNGVKRKLTAFADEQCSDEMNSDEQVAASPCGRLDFSYDDQEDDTSNGFGDEFLHDLSAIQHPSYSSPYQPTSPTFDEVEEEVYNDEEDGVVNNSVNDANIEQEDDSFHCHEKNHPTTSKRLTFSLNHDATSNSAAPKVQHQQRRPLSSCLKKKTDWNSNNMITRPVVKPWNSTPAHDKIKRRLLLEDQIFKCATSSPISAGADENVNLNADNSMSRPSEDSLSSMGFNSDNSTGDLKPALELFSTPQDALRNCKQRRVVIRSPVTHGLTPKNLLQEFEDDEDESF